MTHEGGYTPLNRSGMETHVSPLLKMTFETTTHFLTQAATHGDPDPLTAPSAAIVLGKPVSCGTGAFGLRANLAASCRQPQLRLGLRPRPGSCGSVFGGAAAALVPRRRPVVCS